MKSIVAIVLGLLVFAFAEAQTSGSHSRKFTKLGFIGDWETSALQNVGGLNSGRNYCERSLQFSKSKTYTLRYEVYSSSNKTEHLATIKMKGVWKNVGPAAGMKGVMDFNFYPGETLITAHSAAAAAYLKDTACGDGMFEVGTEKTVKANECLLAEFPQSSDCKIQYGLMKFEGDFTLIQGEAGESCEEKDRAKTLELKWDRKE